MTLKYAIDWGVVIKSKILSVVKVYCSLLDITMMKMVPVKTRSIAVMSYRGTNFSPSHFQEMKTFITTAELELHAIRVRSQKGSAAKWPRLPIIVQSRLQIPLREQKSYF